MRKPHVHCVGFVWFPLAGRAEWGTKAVAVVDPDGFDSAAHSFDTCQCVSGLDHLVDVDLLSPEPCEGCLAGQEGTVDLVGGRVDKDCGEHARIVGGGDRQHPEDAVLAFGGHWPRFDQAVGTALILARAFNPDVARKRLGVGDDLARTLQVSGAPRLVKAVHLAFTRQGVDQVDPHERVGLAVGLDRGQVLVATVLHGEEEGHLIFTRHGRV